jgi:hypothetical protein
MTLPLLMLKRDRVESSVPETFQVNAVDGTVSKRTLAPKMPDAGLFDNG